MNDKNAEELTDQEKEARARYFRDWRARNRDKVRIYNQRYWKKRAEQERKEEKTND